MGELFLVLHKTWANIETNCTFFIMQEISLLTIPAYQQKFYMKMCGEATFVLFISAALMPLFVLIKPPQYILYQIKMQNTIGLYAT